MKDTDVLLEKTGETIEYLKLYAQQQVDIVKLDTVEKSSKLVSTLVTNLVIGSMVLLVLVLLSVTSALFLGQILGNYALGFLIVSFVFVIIAGFIYLFKTKLVTNPTITYFINKVYEDEEA